LKQSGLRKSKVAGRLRLWPPSFSCAPPAMWHAPAAERQAAISRPFRITSLWSRYAQNCTVQNNVNPLDEYSARMSRFRAAEQIFERRFNIIGNWRLAVAAVAAVLAWLVFARQTLSPWWLLVPVAAFLVLVVWHQRVLRARTHAARAADFYERGVARVQDRWVGRGNPGEHFRNANHVYAEDLDLFGRGNLFELICRARTAAGEDLLASWLLQPSERDEIIARQEAVRELTGMVDLREEIALLAEDVPSKVRVEPLAAWGNAPAVRLPRWLRAVASLLAISGIAAVIAFFTQALPLWPVAVILACDFAIIYGLRGRVSKILQSVEGSGRDLRIFSALVERLERESFTSKRLENLRAALVTSGRPASSRIRSLGRLVDWLDSGDHTLVRIIRPLVLWNEQLALSFENWRAASGRDIGNWLRAVAEFEALSSFAGAAFERPSWCIPAILQADQPNFAAKDLKHPLIPIAECVGNDVELGPECPMLVVSGSNMSGKSTLLRAVGLNSALALAGGPVAANELRLSPLQIGASIRLNDSLQDHRSRFFAEITRIRQIVELTRSGSHVLFLLDELLSGTNSHDRRIGAAGIVRELLRTASIGLITTHDLALAAIQQDVAAGISNVHFEDQMDGAEMRFDYKLKAGVVRHSNALALMRAVGLEV
jgi:hypothetical protein